MRRRHLPVVLGLALAVLMSPGAALAHAQTVDPIAEAFLRFYEGRPEYAQEQFDRLRSASREALAPWFGALFVMLARMDYDDSLGPVFEQSVDSLLETASKRYERSAQDAEALFYLAQSYLLRSTYRLHFDKGLWGAARDAAKSKGYAEDYISRHPEHGDAYLTLGLYNYYVDIAPGLVKVLRVLLFLPSGNRAEGLKQLERASREGRLFAPLAEVALADIKGSYEGRLDQAIPQVERLVRRFPGNAEMRLTLASMYLHPAVEDFQRAEHQYEAVRTSASDGSARHISQRHSAILGLASVRRNQWRIDEAIALLNRPVDNAPAEPRWVAPSLLLRRANYRMLVNDPSAIDDARRVLADPAMKTWHPAARRQVTAIESHRQGNQSSVYAALLGGNRLVAEDRFEEARAVYNAAALAHPGDWQVRYRLAYLDFAQQRYAAAATAMETIAAARSSMPRWVKAAALLHLARIHDIQGSREQALRLYKRIVDDSEDESPAGAARLGLIAPYRGR
jgi:tetratricopeptide (TPR) repeat protein